MMVMMELNEWITHEQFQTLWTLSMGFSEENLFTKLLSWKHLKLLDPFSAFVVMGDVGARIYLYYANCKEQLQNKRTTSSQCEELQVNWTDYGVQMAQQFYGQSRGTMAKWKISLEGVLPLV